MPIRVNGVAATSTDGFRHWQASVPLQPGANTLAVESEDAAGQIDPAAAQVAVAMSPVIEGGGPWPYPHRAMLVDPDTGLLLLADDVSKALMALDPETGERVIVSR